MLEPFVRGETLRIKQAFPVPVEPSRAADVQRWRRGESAAANAHPKWNRSGDSRRMHFFRAIIVFKALFRPFCFPLQAALLPRLICDFWHVLGSSNERLQHKQKACLQG